MKSVTLEEITRYRDAVNDNYSSPDYVIEGLPLGLVGSTIAAGASGKSFFCMQQGLSIAIGRNQKRGKVLFLAAEDPKEQFSERLQSIHNAWGVNDEEMDLAHQNFWPIPLLAKEADIVEKLEGAEAYEFINFLKDLYQNLNWAITSPQRFQGCTRYTMEPVSWEPGRVQRDHGGKT